MKLNKIYDIDWMFPSDEINDEQNIKLENYNHKDSERYVP